MRRLLLASALLGTLTHAQTPAPVAHAVYPTTGMPLAQQISALLADPSVARAHWGIAVTTLEGTPIFGLNEGQYFRPASNAKIYTSLAATSLLGLESTVLTTVDADAPVAKGILRGNLSIHGAGDGNFSGRPLPYLSPAQMKAMPAPLPDPLRYIDDFAAGVAAAGVTHITGDVIGDDSLWRWEPYPGSWSIDDMVGYDGSPVSALTIDDNALDVVVTPATTPGQPAVLTFKPDVGFFQLDAHVTTVAAKSPARLRVDREVGSRTLEVFGAVAVDQPRTFSVAITDPAEFAALALKQKLLEHGVKVDGVARAKHRQDVSTMGYVAEVTAPEVTMGAAAMITPAAASNPQWLHLEHKSALLSEDLKVTMKVSQNLHAELFLRRLTTPQGRASGDIGYTAQGAHVVRQFLTNTVGVDPDDFLFYDGSGLSSHDIVTPRATAQVLVFAAKQPWFATWQSALPVGGEDGTISSRFPSAPLKDHVFAKTGTLGESRALSGYLDAISGKQVIFSIMVDTHTPTTSADRVTMDKIVAAIAANN